jgi:hypothetical protein
LLLTLPEMEDEMALTSSLLSGNARIQEAYTNPNRPIAYGEADLESVAHIQFALKNLGYSLPKSITVLGADGKFGDETLAAVRKFQGDKRLRVDGMVGHKTLDAMDAALGSGPGPAPPPPAPPPPGPPHSTIINTALSQSRSAVGKSLMRLQSLQSELQRIDGLNGTAKVAAITNMVRVFSRDIGLIALRLFITPDPMSQTFRDNLGKVIDLVRANAGATSTIKEDGTTGRCTATNFNPPGVPFAASNKPDPDPRVSVCDPFFGPNPSADTLADLQRDVITHEFFHLVGLADVSPVVTTADALNNANTLAQIVAWTVDRNRQHNSDGNEPAIPPLIGP